MAVIAENLDRNGLVDVCRRHGVTRLRIFGSVAEGAARPDSDVDLLIEFDPSVRPTYFELEDLSSALSPFFGGRRVDFGRPDQLHWFIRDRVLQSATTLYER